MGTANGSHIEGSGQSSSHGVEQGRSAGVAGAPQPVRTRGRGRQFKLRWMPPSSTTRASAKARGKKPVGTSAKTEVLNDQSSCSSSQGVPEEEEADGQMDGDIDHEGEHDEDTDPGESDQSEADDYESNTPRPDHSLFLLSSEQSSQASSSRTSVSTVSGGSGGERSTTSPSGLLFPSSSNTHTESSSRQSAYSTTSKHSALSLSPPEDHRQHLLPAAQHALFPSVQDSSQLYHIPVDEQIEQLSLPTFVSSTR